MASADYSVGTKVTADVSNFEKGMNKAEKSLKGFSDKLANSIDRLGKKGLVGSIANVTLAMQGLTKSFGTVIKFAKDVGKAINECTESYKGQVIAERALDTAIQNNPFISGESSKALKEFASEMQKVSNYGDEELIPMMTNLVSLGRTESETMQIMSVAMDMSAGMGISLDTAITQLNATLNGNIGRLGQQNAELKDLTEVELRSGKAIEILGEKFKGLSGATADTSKQLQNIKGDFKEALGQFTLPSSDLWNKFWAGFYQKGIEAINKINSFMDSQIIGKKLSKAITEQIARINPADIGGRIDYTRNVLRVIGDNELEALKNYLSGLRTLSAEQEIILKRIKAEEDSREQSAKEAKKQAEEKAKVARAEEIATVQLKEQEKIEAKKTDWAGKLLDQRIELLETERDRAMQLAEEEGKESYTIWRYYNEKILELKLERVEKEKEKALAEEGLTAEDKIKIEEYYKNETEKIYNELGNYKKKKNEEEKKDEKNKFSAVVEYAKQYAQKIKSVISKVVSTIKNIFSSGVNLFQKLFEFKPDEVLDNILKVEDSILTFFVETLPKTPDFFSSVIQSIATLLSSIRSSFTSRELRDIVRGIARIITDNLPQIISDILIILIEIVEGLTDGLIDWLDSDEGLTKLLSLILQIQKSLEKLVSKALTKLVDMLDKHKGDFAKFLADSMASANRTLPVILKAVLKLITAIVESVAGAFEDEGFINSIVESIEKTVDAVIAILPRFIGAIIKLIVNIISAIVPKLPEIIMYVVSAIAKALPGMAGDIAKALSGGIAKIFSSIFTKDFWIDTLKSFGTVLRDIVKSAFSGFSSSSGGFDVMGIFDPIGIRHWFADGTQNASAGLSVVGEAGPELVRFRGGEQVINNRNTQKLLSGANGNTNNFNVTFNNLQDTSAFAMMNQFKQYNRQMAINGII